MSSAISLPWYFFLTQLYNYPKEDLRLILNDKEFIEYELKNHLVPVKKEGANACYSLESHTNVRQYLPSHPNPSSTNERLANKIPGLIKPEERESKSAEKGAADRGEVPSMIGKEIAKNLQRIKGKKETVIKLEYEGKELDIKTINIQQLVKKFAQKIFKEAKIDVKIGRYICSSSGSTSSNLKTGSPLTKLFMRTTMMVFITRCGKLTLVPRSRNISQ